MATFSTIKPRRLPASGYRSAKHKYAALRREVDRAFRVNSKEAFERLNRRTLAIFDLEELYSTLKAKSEKLEADVNALARHHDAMRELTDRVSMAIEDFDDCQPCCAHSIHCRRVRRALVSFELAAYST
ncbi:hypothetical protein AURDEDRAFT_126678 [Auricularia subglabra TFB-10046 SS5]|nr:hypothetical protein AURDEDRAFT_126678 [Auricularia subglabra TFB-10046 SS5]